MKNFLQIIKSVAIFGSADIHEDHPTYQDAFKAAQRLGQHKIRVIDGGGPGVMKAATDGANSVGGDTFNIVFEPTNAPFFEGKLTTNKADRELRAHDYVERMNALIEASDAYVIFKGGTGTLSEWANVWLLAHIYHGYHKPFILFGSFWKEIVDVIHKHLFIGDVEMDVFRIVTTVDEMWDALQEFDDELVTRALKKKDEEFSSGT